MKTLKTLPLSHRNKCSELFLYYAMFNSPCNYVYIAVEKAVGQ